MQTKMAWPISNLPAHVLASRQLMEIGIRPAARQIGISPTTLHRIEKGHIPDMQAMLKVLKWLGCELSFFDAHINGEK